MTLDAHVCLRENRSVVCKCKPHFILGRNVYENDLNKMDLNKMDLNKVD